MQKQLELFNSHLPTKTRCCDDFDVDSKVRYIEKAIKKRYLQPNDFNSRQWLVYDVDRPTCPYEIRHDRLAPEPTIFVSNPKNRHAHLFYLLKTPVHQNANSSQKAIQFASAVDCGLAMKLDADLGYAGLLAKNALHCDWEVLHTVPQAYELHELAESVDTTLLNKLAKKPLEYGLGRNCILFDDLRQWSYKAIRQGFPAFEQWLAAVEQRAAMINLQFEQPLPHNELKHIAKSVAKWTNTNFSAQGFRQWQSNNGKRSGIARAKLNEDKRTQARLLRQKGLTIQAIADDLSVNKSSVSRWLK